MLLLSVSVNSNLLAPSLLKPFTRFTISQGLSVLYFTCIWRHFHTQCMIQEFMDPQLLKSDALQNFQGQILLTCGLKIFKLQLNISLLLGKYLFEVQISTWPNLHMAKSTHGPPGVSQMLSILVELNAIWNAKPRMALFHSAPFRIRRLWFLPKQLSAATIWSCFRLVATQFQKSDALEAIPERFGNICLWNRIYLQIYQCSLCSKNVYLTQAFHLSDIKYLTLSADDVEHFLVLCEGSASQVHIESEAIVPHMHTTFVPKPSLPNKTNLKISM